ncbi:peptide/nickel transport system permease protein [Streptosporangium becharense]|uniref:Peptide/nickel transport system permease protein n=1 Tax=Streptosporangium becharense TaxID=1816182 RepID=A0A7W9ICV7_9ACTN|nr:ABC transporter permease [Streptosporangium becharense]MBB2912828.1 peptide/nickel transport system permease protein [Streptosporangium becharense]MBB5818347.1 peptide/nickel transport system permease protein [Streptosporangium becharense]
MLPFIIRRLLGAAVTLLIIAAVTFFLFFMVPGDVARLSCGKVCPPELLEQARHNLGLDKPVVVQFVTWLAGIFVGRDYEGLGHCPAPCLGYSFVNRAPVFETILDRLPLTVSLTIGAAVIFFTFGVATGIIAALRQGKPLDKIASVSSLIGASVQIYFIGTLALYFLVYQNQIFARPKYVPLTEDPIAWMTGLLLPWLVLSIIFTANYTRMTRSTMVEQLGEDYVRTARAKGMSGRSVVLRFAMRGTLTPIITILGVDLGTLIGGAIITETTFGLQGLGQLSIRAVTNSDLPMLMATVLVAAGAIVIFNIIVDILYAVIDPRVRLG